MIDKVKITLIEKDKTSLNELGDRVIEVVDSLNDTIDQVNLAINKLENPQKKRRAPKWNGI